MTDGLYIAPEGTPPPDGNDEAGRPITLTPEGITRWDRTDRTEEQ